MPYYRFYFMNAAGHIDRHHEAMLDDDAAAEAEALRLDHAAAIEIWSQQRRVGRVVPEFRRRRT